LQAALMHKKRVAVQKNLYSCVYTAINAVALVSC
jgi:hypothetical protein